MNRRNTKQVGGYEGQELVQVLTTEIKSYLISLNNTTTSNNLFKAVDKLLLTICSVMLNFLPESELNQQFPSIIKLKRNTNISIEERYNILTLVVDNAVNEILKKHGINTVETITEKTDRLSRQLYYNLYIREQYWTFATDNQVPFQNINNEVDRINAVYIKNLAKQTVNVLKHPNRINKLLQDNTISIKSKPELIKKAIDKAKTDILTDLTTVTEIRDIIVSVEERMRPNFIKEYDPMDDIKNVIDYDLLEPNKPIKTIRNVNIYDAINIEDILLSDYLKENPNNIVLEYNGQYHLANKEDIKKQIIDAKYYACHENNGKMARTINGVSMSNIDKDTILYDIKKASGIMIDGYMSFASILNLINADSSLRAFSIAKTTKTITSSVSNDIADRQGTWVSGHHCNTGQANVYTLIPAELNLTFTGGYRKAKPKYTKVKPLTRKQKQLLAEYYNIYV